LIISKEQSLSEKGIALSDVSHDYGSSLLGMIRYGGINRLNPYLVRDLID